eukprot:6211779-Pleurochrysis_carterae.AAC.1
MPASHMKTSHHDICHHFPTRTRSSFTDCDIPRRQCDRDRNSRPKRSAHGHAATSAEGTGYEVFASKGDNGQRAPPQRNAQ